MFECVDKVWMKDAMVFETVFEEKLVAAKNSPPYSV